MEEDDIEQPPASEPTLDEAIETQINRMAGCARLGKWMVLLLLLAGGAFYLFSYLPSHIMVTPPEVRSKSTMEDLTVAMGYYRTEYNQFPLPAPIDKIKDASMRSRGGIFGALLAQDDKLNPRKIKFVDLPLAKERKRGLYEDQGEWVLVDSWGEMYYLALDTNEDNRIQNPEPEGPKSPPFLSASMIVYSSGPDRDPKTWEDNVCSWR
ncbi:MAG: hypothetical protein V4599_06340 [Verrucomicrobiota bacterium]